MDIHEYQAKQLLRPYGLASPPGECAFTADEAETAAAPDRRLALGRQGPDPGRRPRPRRRREGGGVRARRPGGRARDARREARHPPDRQRRRVRPPGVRRSGLPGGERALHRPRARPRRVAGHPRRLRRRRNVDRIGGGGASGADLPGRHRPARRAEPRRRTASRRGHRPRRGARGRRRAPDDRALRRLRRLRRVAHRDQSARAYPGRRAPRPRCQDEHRRQRHVPPRRHRGPA